MEWKNYTELNQDQSDLSSKCFLNLNNNLDIDYTLQNQEKPFYPKYLDNDYKENIQEIDDKMNYYFLLNNMDNSNNEYNNLNQKYDDILKQSIYFPNQKNNIELSLNEEDDEEENKMNKLSSDSSNNENKEQNKKNLFKIQSYLSTSKGDSNSNNIKNKELSSEENNEYCNNNKYQSIPLKERMKLKKEKTKRLLENKTQRINIQEESKENNIEKDYSNSVNNSQENISGFISNNNSCSYSNNNINSINNIDNINSINSINNLSANILSKMSKKEIKMLRNRLSAQRSRDRKKKELIDLKTITKNLLEENEKLRNEIKKRDDKINKLLNLLCSKCQDKIKSNNLEIKVVEDSIDNLNSIGDEETLLTPSNIAAGKKKLALLMTGLFAIFCIFGTFMAPNDQNILRQLKEKNNLEKKNNDFNNEKRVNVPFLIEKDYTIRHKKEIEMYQKIQKNNLKNKNLMVPASLFKNNSEQIISNINNSFNNNTNNNNFENQKNNDNNKIKINDNIKDIIHERSNTNIKKEIKQDSSKESKIENENINNEDN